MQKKQIEIGIMAVLAVFFIIALAGSCKAASGKIKSKPAAVGQKSVESGQNNRPVRNNASAVTGQYAEDPEWGRDPFSGRIYSAGKKTSALHLIGIIWDEKNPVAMINERILKTGDVIQGKQVVRINSDSVIIDDGSKETELKLQQ